MAIHEIETDSKWKILSSSFIVGPMAAVRELIDNSVDGNAKSIHISIDAKTGGCEYISVRDDGIGIDPTDREKMCLNHTTSKLATIDDLSTVSTLGFRGEALFLLASLSCEVGRMEIRTKCQDEKLGEKWFVYRDGSVKLETRKKIPNPTGTTVTIWNLLGGLKSRYIEHSKRARKTIDELKLLLSHYVLNFKDIRFNLELVSLNKNGSVASSQLQHSIASGLTKIRTLSLISKLRKPSSVNFVVLDDLEITDNIRLELILPTMSPESDVINVKQKIKFLSVNNRAISRSMAFGKAVDKVVNSVYKELGLLEPSVWYLNIICMTQLVDVNIEPEKNDILLYDEENTLKKVKEIVEMFLREKFNINPGVSSVLTSPSLHEMRLGSQQAREPVHQPLKITTIAEEAGDEKLKEESVATQVEVPADKNHTPTEINFGEQTGEPLLPAGTEGELVHLSEESGELPEKGDEIMTTALTLENLQEYSQEDSQELDIGPSLIDDMNEYESTQDVYTQSAAVATAQSPTIARPPVGSQGTGDKGLNDSAAPEQARPQKRTITTQALKKRNTRRTITMFSEYTNRLAIRCYITEPFIKEEKDQEQIDTWALSKVNDAAVITGTPGGWRALTKL